MSTLGYVKATNRLLIPIGIVEVNERLTITVDSWIRLYFEEDAKGVFYCTGIDCSNDKWFESISFFYYDWMEDIYDTIYDLYNIDIESIKFELFACGISQYIDVMPA